MTDKIVTEAMLPCPFCGGPAEVNKTFPRSETPWFVHVDHDPLCEIGGADGYRLTHPTREVAIERWNTRSTAQEPALDDDAELPINVTWFSQELREIFRKHFVAWGDSTDWEKIARKALDSLSFRAAIRRLQSKAPETQPPHAAKAT